MTKERSDEINRIFTELMTEVLNDPAVLEQYKGDHKPGYRTANLDFTIYHDGSSAQKARIYSFEHAVQNTGIFEAQDFLGAFDLLSGADAKERCDARVRELQSELNRLQPKEAAVESAGRV